MAESKKNTTVKKKPSTSKKTTKTVNAQNKKASTTASKNASNKNVKKSSKQAKTSAVKNKDDKKSTKTKKNNDVWKLLSLLLVVIVVVVSGLILYEIVQTSNEQRNAAQAERELNSQNDDSDNMNSSSDSIKLTIVEDPTCEICQVDFFAEQIKTNLIPNMEIEKILFDSEEGKKILETLGAQFVPVFLFENTIANRDDWETSLQGAFINVNVSGSNYYLLNPQVVQGKTLIEDPVITETAVVIGNPDAKVTIYEFSDYECPFCAIGEGSTKILGEFQNENPTYEAPIPRLFEEYVDEGLVKFVFYNFPIEQIHPKAMDAHNAALCANEQDYWKVYHDNLFENRDEWIESEDHISILKGYAKDISLNEEEFNACVDSNKFKSQIDEEIELGISYGITGTPAFFINKIFIPGAQNFETFKLIIDSELAK